MEEVGTGPHAGTAPTSARCAACSGCSVCRASVGAGVIVAGIVAAVVVVTLFSGSGAAEGECAWDNYRLPGWITPTGYSVQWTPSMSAGGPLTGTVVMNAKVAAGGLGCVIMHSQGFAFDEVVYTWTPKDSDSVQTATVKTSDVIFRPANQQVAIPLGQRLARGDSISMTIRFRGKMSSTLNGMYISQGVNEATGQPTDPVVVTQFEATYARKAFPCLDEPEFKATFDISLKDIPAGLTALSNMPIKSQVASANGEVVTFNFERSVPMSTYLVAIVVGRFTATWGTYISPLDASRRVNVSVWAPPGNENRLNFALNAARKSLAEYESSFNVAFPLPEMKMAAIESFAAGAMENWGLVTYRLTALLADPAEASQASLERVAVVVAHELAHQWFGNLVTTAFWNQLFLNEGFATLFEYLGTNASNPEFDVWSEFLDNDVHKAMRIDDLAAVSPLVNPNVDSSGAVESSFNDVAYAKGGSVLRMLWKFMDSSPLTQGGGADDDAGGDDAGEPAGSAFFGGLNAYLTRYQYSVATADQLFYELADFSGWDDLAPNMATWSKQPGVPLVMFAWENGDNTDPSVTSGNLCISQRRLWRSPYSRQLAGDGEFGNDQLYWIPLDITVRHPKGSAARKVATRLVNGGGFSNATYTCFAHDTLVQGFVKANANSYGYYRTAYPASVWTDIRAAVNASTTTDGEPIFGAQDRAGLLDDILTVAETQADAPDPDSSSLRASVEPATSTSFATALDYMKTLRTEPEYTVWRSALTHISRISANIYPQATPGSNGNAPDPSTVPCVGEFNDYATYIMTPVVAAIGSMWGNASVSVSAKDVVLPADAPPEAASILARWRSSSTVDPAVRDAAIIGTAASLGFPTVVQRCNDLWRSGVKNIDPNYLGAVASSYVANGGYNGWEEVRAAYEAESEAYSKNLLLRALASATEPAVIKMTLNYTMSAAVDQQDKTTVLSGVASNPAARALAWKFITQDDVWNELEDLYGSGGFGWSSLIKSMASHFVTDAWFNEATAFFKGADLDAGASDAAQALEIVKSNVVLRQTLQDTGCPWLATWDA